MSQHLDEMSMLLVESVIVSFPFSKIHYCVDVYFIFRFTLMRNIFLGISRSLKEYSWNILNDDFRNSDAVRTAPGT